MSRAAEAVGEPPPGLPAPGSAPDACPLCGAASPRALFEKSGKVFWLCAACELVFVHDLWPEFFQGEEDLRYLENYGDLREPKPRQQREWARVLDELETFRERGTLLEVGCGVGLFLQTAAARGWTCTGVEMLDSLARHARDERGLDVRTGELSAQGLPDGAFDVVYANEVIEHVVDPVELLTEVRRVLRPGGVVVLRTGNGRSWTARLRGAGWRYFHFAGHGHIRYFSPAAARALARAAGFEEGGSTTRGFALRETSELRGRWYRPFVALAQGIVSQLAGPAGAGQRLTMRLVRPR